MSQLAASEGTPRTHFPSNGPTSTPRYMFASTMQPKVKFRDREWRPTNYDTRSVSGGVLRHGMLRARMIVQSHHPKQQRQRLSTAFERRANSIEIQRRASPSRRACFLKETASTSAPSLACRKITSSLVTCGLQHTQRKRGRNERCARKRRWERVERREEDGDGMRRKYWGRGARTKGQKPPRSKVYEERNPN
eukprot:6180949-Pleurochrysis_carterae.AAC.1